MTDRTITMRSRCRCGAEITTSNLWEVCRFVNTHTVCPSVPALVAAAEAA